MDIKKVNTKNTENTENVENFKDKFQEYVLRNFTDRLQEYMFKSEKEYPIIIKACNLAEAFAIYTYYNSNGNIDLYKKVFNSLSNEEQMLELYHRLGLAKITYIADTTITPLFVFDKEDVPVYYLKDNELIREG